MIVDAWISATLALYSAVLGLIPEVTLPYTTELGEFADLVGSQVGGLDSFLPISEMLPILSFALLVYLPFSMVFYLVRWVYSMVPVFGRTSS